MSTELSVVSFVAEGGDAGEDFAGIVSSNCAVDPRVVRIAKAIEEGITAEALQGMLMLQEVEQRVQVQEQSETLASQSTSTTR